jgi:hypothetical protein
MQKITYRTTISSLKNYRIDLKLNRQKNLIERTKLKLKLNWTPHKL